MKTILSAMLWVAGAETPVVAASLFAGLILSVMGCQTTKPGESFGGGSEKLYAHRWTLTESDGQPVTPSGDKNDAHLLFFTPNKVSGSTGCNRLTGTFELSGGNKIRFSPLATTRMMCPNADAESRFVKAMGTVDTYGVTDMTLLLSNGQTVVARFSATPAKSEK